MIQAKDFRAASKFVVTHKPDWAPPKAAEYAQLYLEHGSVSAVAREAKRTAQSVGSSLGALVRKYKAQVKKDPINTVTKSRVKIVKAKRPITDKMLMISDALAVLSWAEDVSRSAKGEVQIASTPLGELVWRPKK